MTNNPRAIAVNIEIMRAFGNAAGETFTTSIYPFILRGVTLTGDLQAHCEKLIASGVRGRAVVKFL